MRENLIGFRAIKTIFPFVRPLLNILRVDTKSITGALEKFEELEVQIKELISLPDRFNDLFAPRGWIVFDTLNTEVIKTALLKGENGDINGAESTLTEYYTPEIVEFHLKMMQGISAFRDRSRLANLAAADYAEGRYHACIPVVLALMDGLVNELSAVNRGLFAEGTELKAWDSVSAHDRGWGELIKVLSKGRRKTYNEEISVPYRNGIMHGMDLGYDNKLVAAKAWGALFALREWALKAERNLLQAPLEEPKKSWGEIFKEIADLEKSKKLLESWTPRQIKIGVDVPETGTPDNFAIGSSERRLVEFLCLWKNRNYGHMSHFLPGCGRIGFSISPKQVRDHFVNRKLTAFFIELIEEKGVSVCNIKVRLHFTSDDAETTQEFEFRMIYEDFQGKLLISDRSEGQWIVYNAFYL